MVKNSLTIKALKNLNHELKNYDDDSDVEMIMSTRQNEIEKNEQKEIDFEPGAKNQDLNKRVFIKKYGVIVDLPSYYVLDAKIYPKNLEFCLKVIKYSIPKTTQKVNNYKVDEDPEETTIGELYQDDMY
jgi:hypothetical protein